MIIYIFMITNQPDTPPQQSIVVQPSREQFAEDIKKWVTLDTQLKVVHEKTKQMREMKSDLQTRIYDYMEKANLLDKKIGIHDGELRFIEKKEQTTLSFGYIERCLGQILSEKEQVDYILQYLKEKRETQVIKELRRTYTKK
uniref:Uncharacterized protein n=1 Tax=viral metagenome TaxID=1070528 RepID=A0A6C0DP57_9ZZZZ